MPMKILLVENGKSYKLGKSFIYISLQVSFSYLGEFER